MNKRLYEGVGIGSYESAGEPTKNWKIERTELSDEEAERIGEQFDKAEKAREEYGKIVEDCGARIDTEIKMFPGGRLFKCEETSDPCRPDFCPKVDWPD